MTTSIKKYGIDAPNIIKRLLALSLLCFSVLLFLQTSVVSIPSATNHAWRSTLLITGCFLLVEAGYMLWSSLIGKIILRNKLITQLNLKGDEIVLDIGCGQGLLMAGIAKQLNCSGHVTGIDIWCNNDLSHNSKKKTISNLASEGVSDRTTLVTTDMRQLPFKDGQFDLIVSSMAIHNLKEKMDREKALKEIARVLKPGGTIAIWDFRYTKNYEATLKQYGFQYTHLSNWQLLVFPPARILTAKK